MPLPNHNNSQKQRAQYGARARRLGDRKLGRKQRMDKLRTRIIGDFDRGRQLCYKGKKVIVMQDDINSHPNRNLAFRVFTYIWQGDKSHWDYRWQRVNDMQAMGEWILDRNPTRIDNN
jgi:hypothetical protein